MAPVFNNHLEIAMKIYLTARLVAAALFLSTAGVAVADDIVVHGSQSVPNKKPSLDERATSACLNTFITRLLPGSQFHYRAVAAPDGKRIFSEGGADFLAPMRHMTVEMTAVAARGNEVLATAHCVVNRDAKVLRLETRVTDKARVANLVPADVRLKMVRG
jgi:hypothetical protein